MNSAALFVFPFVYYKNNPKFLNYRISSLPHQGKQMVKVWGQPNIYQHKNEVNVKSKHKHYIDIQCSVKGW